MNKRLYESLQVDSVYRATAIAAAAAAPAVTALIPLGEKHRKALISATILSTDLDNTGAFTVGVVDDTVALPAATGDLAARFAAGETLKYRVIAAGELTNGCTAMTISLAGAAAGDTVVLNGTTFTMAAVPATDFEFADRDGLVAAVNAAGIGITASAGAANIAQFVESELGGGPIVFTTNAVARITPALTLIWRYTVQMEVDISELSAGATGVYGVVDFTAGVGAVTVNGDCVRGASRYAPENAVAFQL